MNAPTRDAVVETSMLPRIAILRPNLTLNVLHLLHLPRSVCTSSVIVSEFHSVSVSETYLGPISETSQSVETLLRWQTLREQKIIGRHGGSPIFTISTKFGNFDQILKEIQHFHIFFFKFHNFYYISMLQFGHGDWLIGPKLF